MRCSFCVINFIYRKLTAKNAMVVLCYVLLANGQNMLCSAAVYKGTVISLHHVSVKKHYLIKIYGIVIE